MLNFSKFIYCCLNPEKETDIYSITQEKIDYSIKENNDEQNQENPLVNPSPKISLLHLKSMQIKKKSSRISKQSNLSIITFSNGKVQKNEENIRVLDTLIIGTHELELEGEIFFNKIITIDRIGLKTSERKKNQNGITIFGINDNPNEPNSDIDFNLNISKNKIKNSNNYKNIPLFSIEFDKNEEQYILNLLYLDIKMLLFIDYNFLIENNTTTEFMLGKVLITIISPKDENDNYFNVIVEGQNYKFDKFNDCPITIGRSNSKINIKNDSISKNHAMIDYQYDNKVISIKDNDSTNGTFFIIGKKCSFIYLLSDLTFKILEFKFRVKINYIE